MSPDRLFTSLHREVIMRQPQIFKMACLRDIKQLFGGHNPFYAGFGNRITDALSYRSVGVPVSRIFTIEYSGDLKLELLAGYISSYIKLNDLVDQIFPPQTIALEAEYNDWNYWKTDFAEIDIPELDEPEPPVNDPLKPENKRIGMLQSLTRMASRSTLSLYYNKSDEEYESNLYHN
ncbi:lipin Ned1 [Basidiobolus ranarum]|uniref:Lipin Ned1 n=1 Tax=Basidiobolus ranarum TaxID=34480 RepID=A0ABR2WLC6_9FUNG